MSRSYDTVSIGDSLREIAERAEKIELAAMEALDVARNAAEAPDFDDMYEYILTVIDKLEAVVPK